jgi:hypothetical protein
VGGLRIALLRNAAFRVTWCDEEGVQVRERREGAWNVAAEPGRGDEGAGSAPPVQLDAGCWVRVAVEAGRLRVWLAPDPAGDWTAGAELARGVAAVAPGLVATRTGLAIVYATAAEVRFWHGSIERLQGETVVPSAQRLDAPPDEVAAPALSAP